MKYELLHMIKAMTEPLAIQRFAATLTLEDKETISSLLEFTPDRVKAAWETYL